MRKLVPLLMIIAVLACTKERSTTSVARSEVEMTAPAPPADRRAREVAVQAAPLRMIIRTANVSVIVRETTNSVEKITAAAESVGGYVSDSKIWRDGELLRATISLRVPADKLTSTLAVIRSLAIRVQSESISTDEVTQEYIDLESQLRNLEATETELRELMKVMRERSKKASEVLQMHQQMMSIRSDIERIKGRMRYLSQQTALAQLGVELIPDAIAQPVVQPGWQPLVVMKSAARSLVDALQGVANVLIWFAIYLLPILLLIGAGVTIAWKLLGRFIRPRPDAV